MGGSGGVKRSHRLGSLAQRRGKRLSVERVGYRARNREAAIQPVRGYHPRCVITGQQGVTQYFTDGLVKIGVVHAWVLIKAPLPQPLGFSVDT